ncbi:MAG: diguanylate cyclase [Pseudomonadota bacterium]
MVNKNNRTTPIRILLLEDNEHDRIAFRRSLQQGALFCQITECARAAEAESLLADNPDSFDLLVLDQKLPGTSGIDFCVKLLERGPTLPMVLLTGHGSEQLAVAALKAGINDYIVKDSQGGYLGLLPIVLLEVVNNHQEHRMRELAELKLTASQLRLQQIVDGSTVATFVIDQDHIVTHWNKACEVMTGTPATKVIGTRQHWRPFYSEERPVMADLILDSVLEKEVERFYQDKFRKSTLLADAYEAETFFPNLGQNGRWLFFTAAPLRDTDGRIIGAIETLQDFTDRRRAEAALIESEERYRQLSITDSLTSLFNSRHFYDQLHIEMARSGRYARPLSLMIMDVDNFKKFNDTYGHLEGDRVLIKLADVIRDSLRLSDSAYRYGGEEFAVLMPETEISSAEQVAERLRAQFAAIGHAPTLALEDAMHVMQTSVSIGVTQYIPNEEFTNLIRRADGGTYQAKRQGKNCVVVVDPTKRSDQSD